MRVSTLASWCSTLMARCVYSSPGRGFLLGGTGSFASLDYGRAVDVNPDMVLLRAKVRMADLPCGLFPHGGLHVFAETRRRCRNYDSARLGHGELALWAVEGHRCRATAVWNFADRWLRIISAPSGCSLRQHSSSTSSFGISIQRCLGGLDPSRHRGLDGQEGGMHPLLQRMVVWDPDMLPLAL